MSSYCFDRSVFAERSFLSERMIKLNKYKIRRLTVSGVFIALSAVLSLVKFTLPSNIHGGSITLLSMLPIAMLSICYGTKWGVWTAFVYSLVQLFFGITMDGLFAWGLTPIVLIGTILLDYVIAFSVLGFSGVFTKKGILGIIVGIAMTISLRFVCHFISGVVLFGQFSESASWIYSLTYNSSYMLPELIITVIAASVLFGLPQIKKLINQLAQGNTSI